MTEAERCDERERLARGAASLLVDEALRGNVWAVGAVVDLAARLCDAVEEMRADEALRKHVNGIAARRITWPGLLGAHPAAMDNAGAVLRELGLGRLHRYAKTFGVPQGPKRARMDSPAQAISIDCRDAIVRLIERAEDKAEAGHALAPEEQEARALPPLAKASFDQWFSLGWSQYRRACVVTVRGAEEVLDPAGRELARKKPAPRKGNEVSLSAWMRAQVKEASAWWIRDNGEHLGR